MTGGKRKMGEKSNVEMINTVWRKSDEEIHAYGLG